MHRGILNTLMNAKQIIRNIPLQLNFHGIDVFIQYSEIDGSLGYKPRLSAAAQEGTVITRYRMDRVDRWFIMLIFLGHESFMTHILL